MDRDDKTHGDRTYRAEVTGRDGASVTGRLRLAEEEALALRDRELDLEDEDGRRIRGRLVGEMPDELIIEREGDAVLVKFVGHYV